MSLLRYLLILLTCFSLSSCFCTKIRVCFTPNGNCTKQIINAVDKAQKSILVQAYQFTSKPIADSLIRAKNRGIYINVILDKSQIESKYSVINELFNENIHIWVDYQPATAHNKILIIDNQKVITGSFNLTYSAQERNTENLLIIEDNDSLAKQYVKNWQERQMQSRPYQPNLPST